LNKKKYQKRGGGQKGGRIVEKAIKTALKLGRGRDGITTNVPVSLYGAGRHDCNAGKSISRAIERGGP
jgi:hypothetical protein